MNFHLKIGLEVDLIGELMQLGTLIKKLAAVDVPGRQERQSVNIKK